MDEIVEFIVDAVCTRKPYVRVDGDEIVKSRLLKFGSCHIDHVIEWLDKNTSKVCLP